MRSETLEMMRDAKRTQELAAARTFVMVPMPEILFAGMSVVGGLSFALCELLVVGEALENPNDNANSDLDQQPRHQPNAQEREDFAGTRQFWPSLQEEVDTERNETPVPYDYQQAVKTQEDCEHSRKSFPKIGHPCPPVSALRSVLYGTA